MATSWDSSLVKPTLLLSPGIPPPLWGLNPRTILGPDWWNKVRTEAYQSTDYHCEACGKARNVRLPHTWLDGHEVYEIDYLLGRMTYVETRPLCHYCHAYIHQGRLRAARDTKEITHAEYEEIIRHGDEIVYRNDLIKRVYNGPGAEWNDWRLILFGKEYKPLRTFEEWRKLEGK